MIFMVLTAGLVGALADRYARRAPVRSLGRLMAAVAFVVALLWWGQW
jgi:hypothetical protein